MRRLLASWEIYLILFLAVFLRVLHNDTVIFSDDEAGVFRLTHDAIIHGLVPLTSNRASLGNLNPPLVVYFFMLPAALSANPLWGQVLVELCNAAAILLTYFFVRRYYGRLAGTIAALLYATSVGAWTFSRNIWPQNFLPVFVILFFCMLFRGVIERRKGWFFWAVVLIGILYQFHGSSLYLLIPLGAAVLFARQTLRWRDLGLAIVALLLLFAPYIYWEAQSHFSDITVILSTAQQHASIDTQALHFYLFFLHPTLSNPYLDLPAYYRDTHLILPDAHSILVTTPLHFLHFFLQCSFYLAIFLLGGGIAIAALQVLSPQHFIPGTAAKKGIFVRWWTDLQASPYRQGLILLLLWQVVPFLLLTRHSIVLFAHYFIFFLPGPFILIALCVVQGIAFVKKHQPRWELLARYGITALAALVILAQLIGCTSAVIDITTGNFNAHVYNNAVDQQNALQEADQLAQQRHIHRIYVMTSNATQNSLEYLAQQIKTPIEFNRSNACLVLPAPEAGPVLLLVSPESVPAATLLSQYANTTLVTEPSHLGGNPYQLFILTAKAEPDPVAGTFTQSLQLLSPTAQLTQNLAIGQQLTTRWRVLNTHAPAFRTYYGFHFQVRTDTAPSKVDDFDCTPTSTWAGDQIVTFRGLPIDGPLPSQISIQASTFINQPEILSAGPLKMLTYHELQNSTRVLLTMDRKNSITLPVAHP